MFTVYCNYTSGDQLLYNDVTPELETCKLIEPKLSLKDNNAGSFEATVPQGNQCYSLLNLKANNQMVRVDVKRDGTWVWSGRVMTSEKDFWLQRRISCEGALAWLNDVVLPLAKMSNYTIERYVGFLLDKYNDAKGGTTSKWSIQRGAISTSTSSGAPIGLKDYVVDGDNVLSYLTKLADDWGLHMRIRMRSGSLYLDMLTDDQLPMSSQSIDFGENLLDYADNYELSDLRTQILPYGKELETTISTGDEEYPDKLSIEGLSATDSSMQVVGKRLRMRSTYASFGCLEETVTWSDVEDPNILLQMAQLYLKDFQFDSMKLTVKTLDLHYMTSSVEAFQFLSQVNCVSRPHGLNSTFIIDEMSIPLADPENTTFSFSRSTMGLYGSDRTSSIKGGKISGSMYPDSVFSREGVLLAARRNATAMIESATNGYVTMVPSQDGSHTTALVISNNADMDQSTRKWTWNVNGLMHQKRSSVSSNWDPANVAITMDGAIVATRITTGVLVVDDGQGGTLFSADMTNHTVHIASFVVRGTKLYSGKSLLNSNEEGVYIGTDGISTGSGSQYMAMSRGVLYGGTSGQNAYLTYNTMSSTGSGDGAELAGRGYVALTLARSGWFGISDGWYGYSEDTQALAGCTGTIHLVEDIHLNGDGTVSSFDYNDYYFYKGILNTVP